MYSTIIWVVNLNGKVFHVIFAYMAPLKNIDMSLFIKQRLGGPTRVKFCQIILFSAPSSSSAGGVTLEAVMAQLERMDARLDMLSTELY